MSVFESFYPKDIFLINSYILMIYYELYFSKKIIFSTPN